MKARNRELADKVDALETQVSVLIAANEAMDKQGPLVDELIAYLEREYPRIDTSDNLQAIQAYALLKISKAVTR